MGWDWRCEEGCPANSGYPEACGSHPMHGCFEAVPRYPYAKPAGSVADANFRLAYAAVQANWAISAGKTIRGHAILSAAVAEHGDDVERLTTRNCLDGADKCCDRGTCGDD